MRAGVRWPRAYRAGRRRRRMRGDYGAAAGLILLALVVSCAVVLFLAGMVVGRLTG